MQSHKQCRLDAAVKLQKLILKTTGTIVPRDAALEVVEAITLSVIKSMEHYLLQPHKLPAESPHDVTKSQAALCGTEHNGKVPA